MQAFNQVILIGNLGADPEIRTVLNDKKVANLRLCVNESYKDRASGEWKNKPQWFRLFSFSPANVGFIERNVKKGMLVQIVGAMVNKSYVQDGETKYTTEIRVDQINLLERPGTREQTHSAREEEDDTIPF
jgi:single-strand DNA-binding protein